MDYNRIYHELITAAQNRAPLPNTTYTERHHIVPTSMGGSNLPSNIVALTLKEHYFAHILLAMSKQPGSDTQWASVSAIITDRLNKSKPQRYAKLTLSRFIRRKLHSFAVSRMKVMQRVRPTNKQRIK